MLPFLVFQLYNNISFFLVSTKLLNLPTYFYKTNFILNYFRLNELLWQEGFLIDFVQKKITDNWIRKFLIYTCYLFNERVAFDKIVRFYLDLIIWPAHKLVVFEFQNVGATLTINIFFYFFIFIVLFFFYLTFAFL